MKVRYESFEELAAAFVDGNSITHVTSGHTSDDCFTWQAAIEEFALWLDTDGRGESVEKKEST